MTMKKEYLSPEVEIIEVGLHDAILLVTSSNETTTNPNQPGPDEEAPFGGRDVNSRPGSGNVWNEGW